MSYTHPQPNFWSKFGDSQNKKTREAFVKQQDILEFIVSEEVFSTQNWVKMRLIGPMLGICSMAIPLIRNNEERFFRNAVSKRLIAIPKQLLGYDYFTGTLDESICPYTKHMNMDNPMLSVAVINYLYDVDAKEKDSLVQAIENNGLRKTFYNKESNKLLSEIEKGELVELLKSVASKGTKESYRNILVYTDQYKKLPLNIKERFIDSSLRSSTEQEAISFLDYTKEFNHTVHLCDSKESTPNTPIKVIKLSEANVSDIYNNVSKLNTSYNEAEDKEMILPINDPINGCMINVMLEERSFKGKNVYLKKFMKDERVALTTNEKKMMLWDLTKLKGSETYDQAFKFLDDMGYIAKGQAVDLGSTLVTPVHNNTSTPPMADNSKTTTLPWGNETEKSVKPAEGEDDFDSIF